MKKTRALPAATLATCLLLLASTPVLAQERHHRGMMGRDSARMHSGMMGQGVTGMMMGSGGMMGMMGMNPAMMMTRPGALLGLSETLGLGEEQTARLEEIRAEARESHRTHMEAARSTHREAREMLQGDSPDMDAYMETLQSAMSHMAQAHASMVRASMEARDVLTEEQRARLESAAQIMRGMHRMQGGMHMGHGSGMGGSGS